MNTLEPRPTEYRGVRFRSKSEAIFARALDLCGSVWDYEPEYLKIGQWVPDFCAIAMSIREPGITKIAIEYKPCGVTDLYREELALRFWAIWEQKIPSLKLFYLATGNAYDTECSPKMEVLKGRPGNFMWETGYSRVMASLSEAKNYRFDLEHVFDQVGR